MILYRFLRSLMVDGPFQISVRIRLYQIGVTKVRRVGSGDQLRSHDLVLPRIELPCIEMTHQD
jgi:hypothetical protein